MRYRPVGTCYRDEGVPCTDGECGWCLHDQQVKKMTLGEKLKATLKAEVDAKLEEERRKKLDDERRRARRRDDRDRLIDRICSDIVNRINEGKKPGYKLHGPIELRNWVTDNDKKEDRDLWNKMCEWLQGEGLKLKISFDHDGMGTDDWLVIGVEPLPEPEVEAD